VVFDRNLPDDVQLLRPADVRNRNRVHFRRSADLIRKVCERRRQRLAAENQKLLLARDLPGSAKNVIKLSLFHCVAG
jgi:hypothetical protein